MHGSNNITNNKNNNKNRTNKYKQNTNTNNALRPRPDLENSRLGLSEARALLQWLLVGKREINTYVYI